MRDYIKRSDAIEALHEEWDGCPVIDSSGHWIATECEYVLDRVPSVDLIKHKKGEWIRGEYWSEGAGMGEVYGYYYKCSKCNKEVQDGLISCEYNYCPNCGADMKGAYDE